jgi:hypothetical protein
MLLQTRLQVSVLCIAVVSNDLALPLMPKIYWSISNLVMLELFHAAGVAASLGACSAGTCAVRDAAAVCVAASVCVCAADLALLCSKSLRSNRQLLVELLLAVHLVLLCALQVLWRANAASNTANMRDC